jgi:RND family efflux transporter MFP subunit
VVQAEAGVKQAEVELAVEEGRVRQAAREWELLGEAAEAPLARREPQLAAAQARHAAAEAQLANARVALERTRLTAPWPAIVLSESLDVGQVVAPGVPVATLMGTERFRVRVSVPVHQIRLLDLPDDGETGPRAVVRQRLPDGTALEREGFLLRTLGELDPETRTAGVLVALDDPLDVPEGTLPILPGAYVEVAIDGRVTEGVVKVPRAAVTDGDAAWVAEAGDRLGRRELVVGWGDADHVYVLGGLSGGDRVVVSPMALPVPGMPLDVREAVAAERGEAP